MTPQVFVALLIAFVAGLAPGSALVCWTVGRWIVRDETFRSGVLHAMRLHPMEGPCPVCGVGAVGGTIAPLMTVSGDELEAHARMLERERIARLRQKEWTQIGMFRKARTAYLRRKRGRLSERA